MIRLITVSLLLLLLCPAAMAERIKDIVDIKGVRGNPLTGTGVVVGLNGTGDNSTTAKRMLANALRRQKIVVDPSDLDSKNIAAVIVRAELGPFHREGQRIDLTVSAFGNTTSLQGGTLLVTELTGLDGKVYAVGEGEISVGGFAASGETASITKNHTTVGGIPSGATVEREETAQFVDAKTGELTLLLSNPDFTTAKNIAAAINVEQPDCATACDAGSVALRLPDDLPPRKLAEFISQIGELKVKVDSPAVVVIDEKTGTIVVGENVMVSTVGISLGSLSIVISEEKSVSQPPPFAPKSANTEVVNQTNLHVSEEKGAIRVIRKGVSVAELARALNAMGVSPRDLASIFRTLKKQGALQAQLKTM